MIDYNGILAQLIADAIEDGYSERQETVIGNQHLLEIGDVSFVTRNQVRGLIKKLDPVVTAVGEAN